MGVIGNIYHFDGGMEPRDNDPEQLHKFSP